MVPHVPVCTYAHVREGDMHLAERVEKKTGTKWDRDQPGARRQPTSLSAKGRVQAPAVVPDEGREPAAVAGGGKRGCSPGCAKAAASILYPARGK